MIETADIVAAALRHQPRGAGRVFAREPAAHGRGAAGRPLDDEIVPMTDHDGGRRTRRRRRVIAAHVTVDQRRLQPAATRRSKASPSCKPVRGADKFITAGNASQLSDGASACVLMEAKEAEQRGLKPLGAFRGFAVAGCEPDEMGIGPVFAVPQAARAPRPEGRRHRPVGAQRGLRHPGASTAATGSASRTRRLNVNGGAISIGHPYGMTGARLAGHVLIEGQRRGAKYARRDDVHRRRHGRRRPVRDLLRRTTRWT